METGILLVLRNTNRLVTPNMTQQSRYVQHNHLFYFILVYFTCTQCSVVNAYFISLLVTIVACDITFDSDLVSLIILVVSELSSGEREK